MKKVLILHGYTTEYRIPFLKKLNTILLQNNVELKVIVGQPGKFGNFGTIENLQFFQKVNNKYFYFKKRYLVWEPAIKYLNNQDLVIIQQANKHLINPIVFIFARIKGIKIGMWGNMKNQLFQSKKNRNPLISRVDHWFAYNELSKKLVEATGFPSNKITSVNNSIDTLNERKIYEQIDLKTTNRLKKSFNISSNDIVGIFCSRLYPDKRIDFLLQSLKKVKLSVPNLKFFVVGEGIESALVETYAKENSDWFFWVGPKFGIEKIQYFKLADFQLLPGAVGLHIVDSFALETPLITTYNNTHGVEIDYLETYKNGIICENTVNQYSKTIIEVCKNKSVLVNLKKGCRASANIYTAENMAHKFAEGILKCLNQ